MKGRIILVTLALLAITASISMDLFARGGGRGGGGGGRGGYGGRGGAMGGRDFGGDAFRSPTMSRTQIPARNNYTEQVRNIGREVGGGRINTPQLIPGQAYGGQAARTQVRSDVTRGQVNQFLQNASRVGEPGIAAGQIGQNLSSVVGERAQTAQGLRQGLTGSGINSRNIFNDNFWANHNFRPDYYQPGMNLWRAATWPAVSSWLGWGGVAPLYYEEGYPITVDSGTSYLYSGTGYAGTYPTTQPTTVQQQQQVQAQQTSSNWLPLGVFALVNDVSNPSNANMFFQLILGKDGAVNGSYYNKSVDKVYPVTGAIDKNSQQMAWKMAVGEGSPIFQTGVFNLTKAESPVQVNFSNGMQQNWLMIRMQ